MAFLYPFIPFKCVSSLHFSAGPKFKSYSTYNNINIDFFINHDITFVCDPFCLEGIKNVRVFIFVVSPIMGSLLCVCVCMETIKVNVKNLHIIHFIMITINSTQRESRQKLFVFASSCMCVYVKM